MDPKFTKLSGQIYQLALADGKEDALRAWVKFVFTDDQPNANRQGIPLEEFASISKDLVYMPIKMFLGGPTGHKNATPLGTITSASIQGNQILAEGALWKTEYDDSINVIRKLLEDNKPVNFSWEVLYTESEIKEGVEWLRGVKPKGSTIVENPAYEGRTPLVALAEKKIDTIEELLDSLQDIVSPELLTALAARPTNNKSSDEDGGTMDELEALKKRIAELEASLRATEDDKSAISEQLTLAQKELQDTKDAEAARVRAEARTKKLSDAGVTVSAEKLERLLSMSDEDFDFVVAELAEATKKTSDAEKKVPGFKTGEPADSKAFIKEYLKSMQIRKS